MTGRGLSGGRRRQKSVERKLTRRLVKCNGSWCCNDPLFFFSQKLSFHSQSVCFRLVLTLNNLEVYYPRKWTGNNKTTKTVKCIIIVAVEISEGPMENIHKIHSKSELKKSCSGHDILIYGFAPESFAHGYHL
jgi:hypothetical protein